MINQSTLVPLPLLDGIICSISDWPMEATTVPCPVGDSIDMLGLKWANHVINKMDTIK